MQKRPFFGSWFRYFGTARGPEQEERGYERLSLSTLRSAARRRAIPHCEELSREELVAQLSTESLTDSLTS